MHAEQVSVESDCLCFSIFYSVYFIIINFYPELLISTTPSLYPTTFYTHYNMHFVIF